MSNPVPLQAFVPDAESGVLVHPAHGGFAYSEGADKERETLEILRKTDDLGLFSESLQRQIHNWQTQYHFSPARHSLLRHVQLQPTMSILELGSGCGAITRQLGETGAEVWAVEGGTARAACTAARTRDLSNVHVVCSDFQLVDFARHFDVVTLIGVLEYSPAFFAGENPLLQCLSLARSLLKPDGALLLAIENQLGLKYFCGAPEDHTGKPFDGVQDLYRRGGVRTVGRAELGRLLAEAGFGHVEFQYPFPDYKLPSWVLTQAAFSTPAFDPCAVLQCVDPTHEGRKTKYSPDERKIRAALHRNGLLADLANSFLVIAGKSARVSDLTRPGLLAAGYVTERRPWFNTSTQMVLKDDGKIEVEKTRLSSAQPPDGATLINLPGVEPYRNGEQLEHRIVKSLQQGDVDAFLAGLRRWIDYLIWFGLAEENKSDVYESIVKPEFFDCTPRNLIVDGDSLHHIDLEWRCLGTLSLRTQILRCLMQLCAREERLLSRYLTGRLPMALQLADRLGIEVSKAQHAAAKQWIHEIHDLIVPDYSSTRLAREQERKKSRRKKSKPWLRLGLRRE